MHVLLLLSDNGFHSSSKCIGNFIRIYFITCACGGDSEPCFSLSLNVQICLYTSIEIYHSSQCSTTGITQAVVCAIMSVGWCI